MYSTRRLNSKVLGPNEGFLTVGDAYDKPKGAADPRVKGKQFQTNPPKQGQTEGYFGKFEHQVDSYQDNNGYRITQPRSTRKLGFGTFDANRRDEFTLDIRAQQYRELLQKEKFFEQVYMNQNAARTGMTPEQMAAAADEAAAAAAAASSSSSSSPRDPRLFQTAVPSNLYDIGREGGTTPVCMKCNRERWYCPHRAAVTGAESLRRTGPHKTAAAVVGAEIVGAEKPQYGRKSQIKAFYDANHLSVKSQ